MTSFAIIIRNSCAHVVAAHAQNPRAVNKWAMSPRKVTEPETYSNSKKTTNMRLNLLNLAILLSAASTLPAQQAYLSKEYIRLGPRTIAVENYISVTDGKGAADVNSVPSCCVVAAADFNGDGIGDLVWQNPSTGAANIWLMGGTNGTTIVSSVAVSAGNSWRIVAAADFDGDSHPDLVWQDPVSGSAQIWYMNGTTYQAAGSIPSSNGNTWRIKAAADFNRDRAADLVWEDPAAGSAQIWYMGGGRVPTILSAASVSGNTSWRIVTSADFNQDGIPDLVWQLPSTGAVQITFMGGSNGAATLSTTQVIASNTWYVVAAADFNSDGIPDLVWQQPSAATVQYWYMTLH